NGRSARVLLVEDDPAVRKLLAELLRGEGVAVDEAGDGGAALKAVEAARPDLMILDLLLPGTDGFAVIEAVRQGRELAGLPILVVTAKDLTPEERRLLQGRTQALLEKHLLTQEKLHAQLEALGLFRKAAGAGS